MFYSTRISKQDLKTYIEVDRKIDDIGSWLSRLIIDDDESGGRWWVETRIDKVNNTIKFSVYNGEIPYVLTLSASAEDLDQPAAYQELYQRYRKELAAKIDREREAVQKNQEKWDRSEYERLKKKFEG